MSRNVELRLTGGPHDGLKIMALVLNNERLEQLIINTPQPGRRAIYRLPPGEAIEPGSQLEESIVHEMTFVGYAAKATWRLRKGGCDIG